MKYALPLAMFTLSVHGCDTLASLAIPAPSREQYSKEPAALNLVSPMRTMQMKDLTGDGKVDVIFSMTGVYCAAPEAKKLLNRNGFMPVYDCTMTPEVQGRATEYWKLGHDLGFIIQDEIRKSKPMR